MDEVVGGAAAVPGIAQAAAGHGAAATHVDLGRRDRAGGIARERTDASPAAQQLSDEEAADVAGGAGHQRGIGFASAHRAGYVPGPRLDSIHRPASPVDWAPP